MIHTPSHTRPARAAIEPQRIAATSTVLALHLLAAGLLLAPVSGVNLPAADPPRTQVHWQALRPVLTPPPPPPVEDIARTHAAPTPALPSFPVVVDQVDVAAVSQLAEQLANAPADADNRPVELSPPPAVPGNADGTGLRMLHAPPPAYPPTALRQRGQGEVMLRVLVGSDGKALSVQIERSSGRRDLDQAARQQVLRRWRFVVPVVDGQPVQAWGRVPIAFNLEP